MVHSALLATLLAAGQLVAGHVAMPRPRGDIAGVGAAFDLNARAPTYEAPVVARDFAGSEDLEIREDAKDKGKGKKKNGNGTKPKGTKPGKGKGNGGKKGGKQSKPNSTKTADDNTGDDDNVGDTLEFDNNTAPPDAFPAVPNGFPRMARDASVSDLEETLDTRAEDKKKKKTKKPKNKGGKNGGKTGTLATAVEPNAGKDNTELSLDDTLIPGNTATDGTPNAYMMPGVPGPQGGPGGFPRDVNSEALDARGAGDKKDDKKGDKKGKNKHHKGGKSSKPGSAGTKSQDSALSVDDGYSLGGSNPDAMAPVAPTPAGEAGPAVPGFSGMPGSMMPQHSPIPKA